MLLSQQINDFICSAIASDAVGLRYFKTVADSISNGAPRGELIAAVLGKAENRYHIGDGPMSPPEACIGGES